MTEDAAKPPSKRGGKRPGAGRPRKAADSRLSDDEMRLFVADVPPDTIESEAEKHARVTLMALVKVLLTSPSDAARITAAGAILDRGYGKPAVEIGGDAQQLALALPTSTPSRSTSVTLALALRDEARKYARLAVAALVKIRDFSRSESARVSAGKQILDRAFGTVGPARLPDDFRERPLGKKEAAARAAVAAGTGIYATPPPPGGRKDH